jgi:hypothetical protein
MRLCHFLSSNFLSGLIFLSLVVGANFHTSVAYAGDRLLATGGVSQIEGAGGGGLTPWALISGYGTDDQIGASAFYTKARTKDGFTLDTGGVAIGLYNRFEVSLSQTKFGLSDTIPHESIRLNTLGLKVRLFGDAIYDQDQWYPQVSIGALIKHNEDFDFVPKLLGAKDRSGVDYYVSATKLYLDAILGRNLLVGTTLIATKANQFGILGFGGDQRDDYLLQPSFSAAVMLTDQLLVGTEYRYKPDNLSSFKENDAKDMFITWFPHRHFSITAAYVDLGDIADKDNQSAWYLSGQISY